MRRAIKWIYDVNPFYVHFKKHYCPQCGDRLRVNYCCKVVDFNSPEAVNYDFRVGDTIWKGEVEFRMSLLKCPTCKFEISPNEMRSLEKGKE